MHSTTRRFGARAIALAMVATTAGMIGSTGPAGAVPSGPQSITVSNESEYRAALATLSYISLPEAAPTEVAAVENEIVLGSDITLASPGQEPTYFGQIDLRIDGQGHTIDADGNSRAILTSLGGTRLTLDSVIAEDGLGIGYGGAVYAGGDLTLVDSTVRDSVATAAGGGIYSWNETVMEGSSLLGNSAPHGDDDYNSSGGGAYVGSLQATASTIAGNTADLGGGVHAVRSATVEGSTISGNVATGGRGYGGAVVAADLTLDNSTVAGNSAEQVGGIVAQISLTATLSTITGNATTTGPANLEAEGKDGWSSFGTVIAEPNGGANCLIGDGPIESAYSYATDDSCVLEAPSDESSGADPQLGALADNGGPTETRLPALTSPLLDRIPSAVCEPYPIDQRGEARPEATGTGCDVGSVEGSDDPVPPVLCFGEEVTVDLAEGEDPTEGPDVILGTDEDDEINALGGSDLVCGLGGADTITGGTGLDQVSGGAGDDTIGGGVGPDQLQGNQGADALVGANGVDRLVGGRGADRLAGGAGDDHLAGGIGRDRCDGGAGTDTRQTCEVRLGFP
jgi:Ca2+-binding RTX toxin-like protein